MNFFLLLFELFFLTDCNLINSLEYNLKLNKIVSKNLYGDKCKLIDSYMKRDEVTLS
jgi:hypothetical protein